MTNPILEAVSELRYYTRGVWRHRWVALAVAWLVAVAGWLYVRQMPDRYEASARVFVDTRSILRPLLRGLAIEPDVNQRVAIVTRTLLSRPNLEKLARMTDQDLKAATPEAMEQLIDRLRDEIRISGGRENLYTISYEHEDPKVAKRTVQSLLNILVESALGESRRDTDTAQRFLDEQLQEYARRLDEAQKALTEFKRANVALLAVSGGSYFARLEEARAQLEQARLALREAQFRRDELARQLADAESGAAAEDDLLAAAPAAGGVATAYDGRIQALQQRLDELLLKYTEEHPDVLAVRATLQELEKRREEELAARAAGGAGAGRGSDSAFVQQLRIALSEAEANVAAARVRVQSFEAKVEELRKALDTIPRVEAELARLTRDVEVNKQNYEALLKRRETARLTEEAATSSDQVRFRIIDPPHVPLEPSAPNRLLLNAAVFLAALAAGAAAALLLVLLRPVFDEGRMLRKVTGRPVLGSVGLAMTPGRRWRTVAAALPFLILGLGLAGALAALEAHELGRIDLGQVLAAVEAVRERLL
ncbi:XrtA system polysaccharide chain length determinant [Inmirania thermothiophila]|uniref:Polysaccharide chain length determinant protein (PEP-CTERM system associated) n=1 Tax=Inmirania thermothiophila TaxID=1750597 RepID=A0A3N1Y7D3_9GAMM|nr:XrtA system polysaccharide chain length determinant [Inmirania thermothiophila]ROR34736.1 polysaccharide chain length determinant protein (PEP-CTERM system associated) [Inmirania thermothiophila]